MGKPHRSSASTMMDDDSSSQASSSSANEEEEILKLAQAYRSAQVNYPLVEEMMRLRECPSPW
jgi:hypothetical protein